MFRRHDRLDLFNWGWHTCPSSVSDSGWCTRISLVRGNDFRWDNRSTCGSSSCTRVTWVGMSTPTLLTHKYYRQVIWFGGCPALISSPYKGPQLRFSPHVTECFSLWCRLRQWQILRSVMCYMCDSGPSFLWRVVCVTDISNTTSRTQ